MHGMAAAPHVPTLEGIFLRYDTNAAAVYADTTANFKFECGTMVGSQKTIETVGNAGAVRAANVATIKTTAAHGFAAGNIVRIAGVTDAVFNGTWLITGTPLTTTFTYANTGTDGTSGGGTADAAATTTANSTIAVNSGPNGSATGFHTLHVTGVGGTVNFSVDGEVTVPIATNCPTTGFLTPAVQLLTDTTAQKIVRLDYFALRQTGVSR
jgi:hypothetical protein